MTTSPSDLRPTPADWIRKAALLLAAYKLRPEGGTLPELLETIQNFTDDDFAHVARIAADLEAEHGD